MRKNLITLFVALFIFSWSFAQPKVPRFRVIALYENGGHHVEYSKAAKVWLDKLAADSNFNINYIQNTDKINDEFLSRYQLFLQLDYAPYAWKPEAVKAFEKYIEEGRGGWIGFHHATLLGEFDGYWGGSAGAFYLRAGTWGGCVYDVEKIVEALKGCGS